MLKLPLSLLSPRQQQVRVKFRWGLARKALLLHFLYTSRLPEGALIQWSLVCRFSLTRQLAPAQVASTLLRLPQPPHYACLSLRLFHHRLAADCILRARSRPGLSHGGMQMAEW